MINCFLHRCTLKVPKPFCNILVFFYLSCSIKCLNTNLQVWVILQKEDQQGQGRGRECKLIQLRLGQFEKINFLSSDNLKIFSLGMVKQTSAFLFLKRIPDNFGNPASNHIEVKQPHACMNYIKLTLINSNNKNKPLPLY